MFSIHCCQFWTQSRLQEAGCMQKPIDSVCETNYKWTKMGLAWLGRGGEQLIKYNTMSCTATLSMSISVPCLPPWSVLLLNVFLPFPPLFGKLCLFWIARTVFTGNRVMFKPIADTGCGKLGPVQRGRAITWAWVPEWGQFFASAYCAFLIVVVCSSTIKDWGSLQLCFLANKNRQNCEFEFYFVVLPSECPGAPFCCHTLHVMELIWSSNLKLHLTEL